MSDPRNLVIRPIKLGLVFVLLAAVIGVVLLPNRGSAAGHPSCGDTITSDTTLTGPVLCGIGFAGNALTIATPGITLDGDGHKVSGTGAGIGSLVIADDVVVTDIVVEGFKNGIIAGLFGAANDFTLTDSTVSSARGVRTTSSGHTLTGNSITGAGDALLAQNGAGNRYANNVFVGGCETSISAVDSIITNNKFVGTGCYGLRVLGSGNTVNGNSITGKLIALYVNGASNSTVFENELFGDHAGGRWGAVHVNGGATGNVFYNNNFRDNDFHISDQSSGTDFYNLPLPVGGNWYDDSSPGCANVINPGFGDASRSFTAPVGGKVVTDNFPLATEAVATPLPAPAPPLISYTANVGSNDVSVVDISSRSLITTVPVGAPAFFVVAAPDGSRVYATTAATVEVINTTTNTVDATISLPALSPNRGFLGGIVVSPDGSRLYVTRWSEVCYDGNGSIAVIDTSTFAVSYITAGVGILPTGLSVTPDGTQIYVANQGGPDLEVFDTATFNHVRNIATVAHQVEVSSDLARAFAAVQTGSMEVKEIVTATGTIVDTLSLGSACCIRDTAMNPVTGEITVATNGGVFVVDGVPVPTLSPRPSESARTRRVSR